MPEGATFLSNGRHYRVTYVGGEGNDVVVTDIEPVPVIPTLGAGGLAALVVLLALAALFVLRRRSI